MQEIKTVLFDLDGTLLPMEGHDFEKAYLQSLGAKLQTLVDPEALMKAMWKAMGVMVQNQDYRINQDVFYEAFRDLIGSETFTTLLPHFDAYYEQDFDAIKEIVEPSFAALETVRYLKEKGYTLVLATNPIMPEIPTNKRIAWAGLDVADFVHVTRFETNHYCKPSKAYYQEIMDILQADPHECLMIGNDVEEDLIAGALGMKTWLVEDNLIHRGSTYQCDWQGDRNGLLAKVKASF